MNIYEQLAQKMFEEIDFKKHTPPEPASVAVRGEMAVLCLLGMQEKGMCAGEISAALSMTTSRIAAVLKSLEKKNLIIRKTDPGDKRRVMVFLTEKGNDFRLSRQREIKARLIALLSRLSPEDAETFVRLVGKLFSDNDCSIYSHCKEAPHE